MLNGNHQVQGWRGKGIVAESSSRYVAHELSLPNFVKIVGLGSTYGSDFPSESGKSPSG